MRILDWKVSGIIQYMATVRVCVLSVEEGRAPEWPAQGVTGEPRTALASHPVLLEPRTDSGYERTGGGATCCSRFSDSSGC